VYHVWKNLSRDLVERYFINPNFHFTYEHFDWVEPLSPMMMKVVFVILGIAAVNITIGFLYRTSLFTFAVLFIYTFLLDETRYNNHYYVVILYTVALFFIPADKCFSVRSLFKKNQNYIVPQWNLWILRFHIGVTYLYGGIAKLNYDWLVRYEPMRYFLEDQEVSFLKPGDSDFLPRFFSYSGCLFDLLIVPLLLYKKTRLIAFTGALLFHLSNSQMFHIGVFPVFATAASLLYFQPDWPLKIFKRESKPSEETLSVNKQQTITLILCIYVAIHLLIPFRHHLYRGSVAWNKKGQLFSYQMKLNYHDVKGKYYLSETSDLKGEEGWYVSPKDHLEDFQWSQMAAHPKRIVQFARYLKDYYAKEKGLDVEVRFQAKVSLNKRPFQLLINPYIDLTQSDEILDKSSLIFPLEELPKNE